MGTILLFKKNRKKYSKSNLGVIHYLLARAFKLIQRGEKG